MLPTNSPPSALPQWTITSHSTYNVWMSWMIKCPLANDIWMMWMKTSFTMTVRRCLTTLCARARKRCWQQLRRVRSSLLELSLCSALLLQHRWRVFVARIRGFSFSVFTGGSRASCCERCVFFLFWKGVLRFGGTAGVKKARKEQRKAGFRFVS